MRTPILIFTVLATLFSASAHCMKRKGDGTTLVATKRHKGKMPVQKNTVDDILEKIATANDRDDLLHVLDHEALLSNDKTVRILLQQLAGIDIPTISPVPASTYMQITREGVGQRSVNQKTAHEHIEYYIAHIDLLKKATPLLNAYLLNDLSLLVIDYAKPASVREYAKLE